MRRAAKRPPLTRSETMARVRSRDTSPEMIVRRALWRSGLRYRLQARDLPGKPDIVFRSAKVAIFVHGCFWHQHPGCQRSRLPTSRPEYWLPKLQRNVERDAAAKLALEKMGWQVCVLWECELRNAGAVTPVINAVRQRQALSRAFKPTDQSR